MDSRLKMHPGIVYAQKVVKKKIEAPKYIIKQCKKILKIAEDKDKKYMFNMELVELTDGLLSLMVMPNGLKVNITMNEALAGFQRFFLISVFCIVERKNPQIRKHKKIILEICRKNGKTIMVAIAFIISLLLEPKFSRFYSVAPDGSLSREIKESIRQIIKSSPALYPEENPELIFEIKRDWVKCKTSDTTFFPLNYSNDRLDGKLPTVFIVDEAGALPNNYAIEAMQSGQLTIDNNLGFIISTKYPTLTNPFEDEVEDAKKIIDDLVEDESVFALLYEPDNPKEWQNDDKVIMHGNPLALEVPKIMEELKSKRARAIRSKATRSNFLTKHCNIHYVGSETENYVDIDDLRKCKTKEKLNWDNMKVYVGLDLAMTTDNVSFTMVGHNEETGKLQIMSKAFIPEDKIEDKSIEEKVDYTRFIKDGNCYACGDVVIDYGFVESMLSNIEKDYNVKIEGIGYDRYNALSTMQKMEELGYTTVEVKQHSSVLHPATKLLHEMIIQGKAIYEDNLLYEINFMNAKCTFDNNMNRYVNKKKSRGKVDMVVSTIIAMVLYIDFEQSQTLGWVVQEG